MEEMVEEMINRGSDDDRILEKCHRENSEKRNPERQSPENKQADAQNQPTEGHHRYEQNPTDRQVPESRQADIKQQLADSLRTVFAVAVCKASRAVLHRIGRGGTSFPGKAAMVLKKDLLTVVSQDVASIVVTGTNGKTTTAAMLESVLRCAGLETVSNRSGANLLSGVTAELAACTDWRGRAVKHYAVIECDEGALHQVVPLLRPKVIIVTNLFRDQLDRYGEVMHTLEAVRRGIEQVPEAVLCLNADDSLTASLALDLPNPVAWFGIGIGVEAGDPERNSGQDFGNEESSVSDARYCIRCGTEYVYSFRTFAHLGGFRCPACGYARPDPDVEITSIDSMDYTGTRVHMRFEKRSVGMVPVNIAAPALYNIYNAAAAACSAQAAGISLQAVLKALASTSGAFGRMETFEPGGAAAQMILVKNPAGCNQALDYLCSLKKPYALILCLNDRDADGHDISWIWDVDYEKLCQHPFLQGIYVWGIRAEDLQLRLKYAGIPESRIRHIRKKETLLMIIRGSKVPVFILPNYTAMLPLRELLQKETGKAEFWKGNE
ncbi:MAG: MurT ligase domain-containing protein [Lachnospiraceae bacterium]|nr:MurT ligase domain-containing protein [Lachnospiraceae bacterium]